MDRAVVTILRFEHNGQEIVVEAERLTDGWRVRLPDDSLHDIHVTRQAENTIQFTESASPPLHLCPERMLRIPFVHVQQSTLLAYEGQTYRFTPIVGRRASAKTESASGLLSAPMAGVLAEVTAVEGKSVTAGQSLAVIEAMKVMTTLEAPFAGKVGKVYIQKGQRVEQGAPVVEIVAETPPNLEPEHA